MDIHRMPYVFHSDSVEEFMYAAYNDKCPHRGNETYRTENNAGNGQDWAWYGLDGSAPPCEAIPRLVREGWGKGVGMVKDKIAQIHVPWIPSVRRRMIWTDMGDELHMDRVYSGQLDAAWRRGWRKNGVGPATIKIIVDNCFSWDREAKDVMWRGIAALAACDALTEAGHMVEVITAYSLYSGGQEWTFSLVTKHGTQPVDLGTLAATTAHPGFFRNTCLAYAWTKLQEQNGGCGGVRGLKLTDFDDVGIGHMFIVPQGTDSKEDAQTWVHETLSAFTDPDYDADY